MTKRNRIINILRGVLSILLALLLIVIPNGGLTLVLFIIGIGLTLKGIQTLLYYFSIARHMVDGKLVLCQGLIFLDLGMFTSSIADNPAGFLIAYIAAVDAFTGLVSILHSLESKRNGSLKWRYDFIFGLVSMLLAVIVLIGGFVLKRPYVSVCAYAFGLIYSSALQIASAFRRNAIVYIA
jgi:uncharacterized membrane protein HdeD (DUF308 family)